ncbi:Trm112p-domain-containing protein [Hyphopichia burtonii NRRL Y-1933]|uniref:Multifunctional methyltransferase subunit trm112 n=1 Tax=Hyphopichia burtonii NRRL Y-1933 TaxID=984485 RepID=A0A1E4RGP3_9ASCO|nr:Trm112p-domain-containing protein [Hyphopichia burtonii NRRL Y-1933]ODV66433.1 Trm112p-domain-containing protein [Hyphopichia burtonii NRRL Y-1933]
MKFLTTNFVKCAVKSCNASTESFPLKYTECELAQEEQEYNPEFLCHMLERLDWDAVVKVAKDLGNDQLPPNKPTELDPIMEDDQLILKDLHALLIETQILEGKMTCNNCGHIYYIKNSVPNFLLPPHLC